MLASPVCSSCAECIGWLLFPWSHTQKDEVPHDANERVGESLFPLKMCLAMHWKEEEEEQRRRAKAGRGDDQRLVHTCT